jgi:hypothetical protein
MLRIDIVAVDNMLIAEVFSELRSCDFEREVRSNQARRRGDEQQQSSEYHTRRRYAQSLDSWNCALKLNAK